MSDEIQTAAEEGDAADDWASALAEQREVEAADAREAAPGTSAVQGSPDSGAETTISDPNQIFGQISQSATGAGNNELSMILDIPVQLTVELGRTRTPIKHILQLAQGSVIELDALAGEPMDILVNGFLIAQGEVVVVNDRFGVRVTDIVTPSERLRRLNR